MATQTPAVGDGRGSTSPTAGHHPITEFWFETPPGQDEVRARLAALEAAKHATHTVADPFCPLCPTVRRAPLSHLSDVCRECGDLFEPSDGETAALCDTCTDGPHEFRHDGSRFDFCVCGRIRSIGGYSPAHHGWADQ